MVEEMDGLGSDEEESRGGIDGRGDEKDGLGGREVEGRVIVGAAGE